MEAKEQAICSELKQVNEKAQTIESHQEAAQTALRARQKEKQKIQVKHLLVTLHDQSW